MQLQALPEQGLKAKLCHLNFNIFYCLIISNIFVNLEEEVEMPCGDDVYYTNHQIHAKHIKIRELRSAIHSLEHDIEDGFEKEFRVGLD